MNFDNQTEQFRSVNKHYRQETWLNAAEQALESSSLLANQYPKQFGRNGQWVIFYKNEFYSLKNIVTGLLDNIFIRLGSKLYRQIVGIPIGTNCAPLVADLFLFCY